MILGTGAKGRGWPALAGVAMVMALGVLSGCGSEDAAGSAGIVTTPKSRPEFAAQDLASLFDTDATSCDDPILLDETAISKKILAQYSCEKVLTPREFEQKCSRLGIFATGNKKPVRLNSVETKYELGWAGEAECPNGAKHRDQGTYEAVVTKVDGGWIATGFKILSGPGKWDSDVVAK